ncbi:MAG TPA: hypothetical protein VN712_09435 [Dermatophilaceae bacterium]|nr:hypothetical protein [Dermatophilaceae bacterium]
MTTRTNMTTKGADPVKVLADALLAADLHTQARDDRAYCEQVVSLVIAGIRAHTDQGAAIRASLGMELSETTRVGKNIRAAMDAFTRHENKPE